MMIRTMNKLFLLSSFLLAACASSRPEAAFFLGEWTRSDPFGENQTSMTSWTFRENGTLTRDGYPPFFAEARYTIRSADSAKATLALRDKTGPQADELPDEMEVVVDADKGTLSVNGSLPLAKQRRP